MKTLLFLFCLIVFASTSFTPNWYDCGNSSATNVFTPTNVTVQRLSANDTWNLVSACGTVNSHGLETTFTMLKVDLIYDDMEIIFKETMFKVVKSGSDVCFDYQEQYEDSDIFLLMTAYNVLGKQAACVNITLNWTDTNPGFLSKRKELIF